MWHQIRRADMEKEWVIIFVKKWWSYQGKKVILQQSTTNHKGNIQTQERRHNFRLNCPHSHFAAIKPIEEELLPPPSILKTPKKSGEFQQYPCSFRKNKENTKGRMDQSNNVDYSYNNKMTNNSIPNKYWRGWNELVIEGNIADVSWQSTGRSNREW